MVNQVFPHDLLWGMSSSMLPVDAPNWVYEVLDSGWPVVVRRASVPMGKVAVGIRGRERSERYATVMPLDGVNKVVRPQDLIGISGWFRGIVINRITHIERIMSSVDWIWGYGGSLGFELASGIAQLHENSDVDILVWPKDKLDRLEMLCFQRQVMQLPFRVDMQIQTLLGGFSLNDWLASEVVLLKTEQGPLLTSSVWK